MALPELDILFAIAAGTLLLIVPARMSRRSAKDRAARLSEIESGAEENYFEEKRSLQAYASPTLEILRAAGLVLVSLGLARLLYP